MPGIICAIRGGPSSQPTIERAIALAKETKAPLRFLYVVNLEFLARSESSRTRSITRDLEHLGEFILLTAKESAQAKGIQAEGIVRHGDVPREIIALAKELEADEVILGRPSGEHENDAFTMQHLEALAARIEEESGAHVILVKEGA
jgi:nucleotide-binding universal stress UspA family protein